MILIERILNPQALTALYKDELPLDGAELVEIQMKRDEPRLMVRLMTTDKPTSAPSRWPKDYDVVSISLSFIGVRELSISHWGHDNTEAAFRFTSEGGAASVAIDCKNGAALAFVCDWVRVEGVTYGHLGSL